MKMLFGIGLILLSLTGQAEIMGTVCDEESKITFDYDFQARTLTGRRSMVDGVTKPITLDLIEKRKVDTRTYTELKAIVKDLMYGDYFKTEDSSYVLAYSHSGVFYVFEENYLYSNYEIFGSSKKCRDSQNPFAKMFDAYDLPISTLVMIEKKYEYTNSNYSNRATSRIFINGDSKVQSCEFVKEEKDVAPLKPGQVFEVASVERNYFSGGPGQKLVEIKLNSEKFGALSCLSQFGILNLTIGDMYYALKKHGVVLDLPNKYLPEDLASDALEFPSFRLINPVVIKAGTNRTKIGGSYGRIEGCFYEISEVATETKTITSMGRVVLVKDYEDSYLGTNDEYIDYSGVNIQFENGASLYCVSFDHITRPLFIHDFLRALNFGQPNISVNF